ncbi:acyl-CoA synthetase [Marinibaculum pumilum]|uniref:Acyl-CoA synthetase n=1 Tax=Marinibaculum pumilum TaxID=1766165 RepID=A0ABV7KWV0_9PROT
MEPFLLSGERRLSRAQMLENAARAATGFDALGIGPDDSIAYMLRNDFPALEVLNAANHIGALAVPMNWHFGRREAGHVLRDCAAKALVVHEDLLPQIPLQDFPDLKVLVVPTPPELRAAYRAPAEPATVPATAAEWHGWVAGHAPWTAPPPPARGSMIYTSGTTGVPKGVRRKPADAATAQASLALLARGFGVVPGMRTVMTGPLYHSATVSYARGASQQADCFVLMPRFDAEELLALIERHRLGRMHMVPTMFVRLLRLPDAVKRKYDLSSLEFVVHGAAPCPPEVKRAMIDWWGPVIHEYYGSTEASIVTVASSDDWLKHPGTVGRPDPERRFAIVGEDGRVLPPGETGEIFVGLEGLSDFTYNRMDEKRAEIDRDGMVTNGDVGFLNGDGYLFLCDRKRDMIISGGVNIYPAEIEAEIMTHPAIADCAVFGIPDDEFGEAIAAAICVQAGHDLSAKDLSAYLAERMARYKLPRVIDLHDSLPREDSGKIFKQRLRAPYWEKAGRQI